MNRFVHNHPSANPPQGNPGSWNVRKGRLLQQFPILTDNDVLLEATNREEMFGNLLRKLNVTSDELHAIIIAL